MLLIVVIFVFKVAVIEPMNLKSIQHFSNQNKTIDYVMMMFQVMTLRKCQKSIALQIAK